MTATGCCQNAGGGQLLSAVPWQKSSRVEAKDEIAQTVLSHRDGIAFSSLIKNVFGESTEPAGADYQLARRFVDRYPDWFKTDRRGGLLWVQPTADACQSASLDTASKQTAGTQDGVGVALSNAKSILRRRRTVSEQATRGDLLGAFGAKRQGTENRFHAFEDTFNPGEHLLVPYSTRFNSERRVAKARNRFRTGWSIAAEQFKEGVIATLTTDPSRYNSLFAATKDLLDDVNHLKRWLAYSPTDGPSRPGHRLPTIVVPEFTEDGKPHVHVAFFGEGWLTTQRAISRYWDEARGRGQIVHLDRIVNRNGRWRWAKPRSKRTHADTAGRTPRSYLEEGVELLEASANASAEDIQKSAKALRHGGEGEAEDALEDARRRGERLWKVTLYWATELPIFTLSPTLKASNEGDEQRAAAPDGTRLPIDAPPRYRYVGTAQYEEFPAYIRDGARVVLQTSQTGSRQTGQPPPIEADPE